jgi:hypothetical protein
MSASLIFIIVIVGALVIVASVLLYLTAQDYVE